MLRKCYDSVRVLKSYRIAKEKSRKMRVNKLAAMAIGLVTAITLDPGIRIFADGTGTELTAQGMTEKVSATTMVSGYVPTESLEAMVTRVSIEQKADPEMYEMTRIMTKATAERVKADREEDEQEKAEQEAARKAANDALLANQNNEIRIAKGKAAGEKAKKAAEEAAREKRLAADMTGETYNGVRLLYSEPYQGIRGHITRSNGVVHYNGNRETWYSVHEPGQTVTAVKIPGKHVAKDGTIRDADGFICVAASQRYKRLYTTLMTSIGPAKVYDTGCSYGTIDIYTTW